jgi:hypothetical protein
MKSLINSRTEDEQALVRETEPGCLDALHEDELLSIHDRIRRARNKYVKLYRRQAASRVAAIGGRGIARPKNRRNAQKAEVFEDALARVSRYLAKAARRSAAELKAERLRAARVRSKPAPAEPVPSQRSAVRPSQRLDRTPTQPVPAKQRASTRAKGARRQAKRDNRRR